MKAIKKPPTKQDVIDTRPVKPKFYGTRVIGGAMIYMLSIMLVVMLIVYFVILAPADSYELMEKAIIWLLIFLYVTFVLFISLISWRDTYMLTSPINWLIGLKKYSKQLTKYDELYRQYRRHQSYLEMKEEYESNKN